MFLSIYLNSLFLNMPTMNINKGDEEDSDDEEEVLISERGIDVVTHARRSIDVGGTKMPMTIKILNPASGSPMAKGGLEIPARMRS